MSRRMVHATFDRWDIAAAHYAMEIDYNVGGWLRERPSNQRRRESTDVQLHRMGIQFPIDYAAGFEYLANDNQRAIYVWTLACNGLALTVDPADETHADIIKFLQHSCPRGWVRGHFPRLPA